MEILFCQTHVNCEGCWPRHGFTEPCRNTHLFYRWSCLSELSKVQNSSRWGMVARFEMMNALCVDWIHFIVESSPYWWLSSRSASHINKVCCTVWIVVFFSHVRTMYLNTLEKELFARSLWDILLNSCRSGISQIWNRQSCPAAAGSYVGIQFVPVFPKHPWYYGL